VYNGFISPGYLHTAFILHLQDTVHLDFPDMGAVDQVRAMRAYKTKWLEYGLIVAQHSSHEDVFFICEVDVRVIAVGLQPDDLFRLENVDSAFVWKM